MYIDALRAMNFLFAYHHMCSASRYLIYTTEQRVHSHNMYLCMILWPGSCTNELQLKVNCRPKVNRRIKFVLAWLTVGRPTSPNFFLQFTFSCISLVVHDPAIYKIEKSKVMVYMQAFLGSSYEYLKKCLVFFVENVQKYIF